MTEKLQRFIGEVELVLADDATEERVLEDIGPAMGKLVAADDWLAPEWAMPHPRFYQQYLLHLDPRGRFSVVSFVWGPGQQTPIHDHLVWGVIGMLRGSEIGQGYRREEAGVVPVGPPEQLLPGQVAAISPTIGDIHRVSNAHADRVSVSIHVYGTDIGSQRRHVYDQATGAAKEFISGYAEVQRAAA